MFSANVLFYKSTIRDIYEASGRKKKQKKKMVMGLSILCGSSLLSSSPDFLFPCIFFWLTEGVFSGSSLLSDFFFVDFGWVVFELDQVLGWMTIWLNCVKSGSGVNKSTVI